jgi:heterodisulfide reductase subunit B2
MAHIDKEDQTIHQISAHLAQRVQQELGENVYLCYQCVKCTSGCPVAQFMDWRPNQVMRALQLGQEDIALHAETPWLCASCQTCTTRCPQGINIAAIMEFLTRESMQRGFRPTLPQVDQFNKAFLREVRIWGRAYEPGLMVEMKLRNPSSMFDDLDMYSKVLLKRKVAFLPTRAKPPRRAKPVAEAAQSVAYYPGCSLESMAAEFNHSTKAVCEALDIHLVEPKGWVCCGSSAAHRADPQVALDLPLKNLALIEQSGFSQVAMPCAACFNRHQAALYEIRHHPQMKDHFERHADYRYQDSVRVVTLPRLILEKVGKQGLQEKVTNPLRDLKVVSYYGCLLTRPPEVTGAESPENPTDIDELMDAIGAQAIDWSYKTSCCGAAHSLTRPDIVLKLSGSLLEQARLAGADAVAVACPLCHLNLDARQMQMKLPEPVPVLYITQLMAVALGLPLKKAALQKNLIDPRPLLRQKGLIA